MFAALRRLPMLFVLVAGVAAGFYLYSRDHETKRLRDIYALQNQKREDGLIFFMHLARGLGKTEQWDQLNQILEIARKDKSLDFYLLQFQGTALWSAGHEDDANFGSLQVAPSGVIMFNAKAGYISDKIGDDYQLTIGIDKDVDAFLKTDESQDRLKLWTRQSGIFVLLIVSLVGFWTLKDIMLLVREARRGKRGNVKRIRTSTAEAEVFMKSLTGYSSAMAELEAENARLGRQVLPSLQKEMNSGRKPPYDFNCTMVRTDINHFSTIFNTHNVTEFMATINSFFDEVSRVVARYGGLIHEFVGDEVIYYFKDDDHPNSFATALSAVRDVNAIAARYHAMTMAPRGYPFTVKSSAAHGKVRFGPLVGGFTIAGATLIETVRVLSFIREKEDNVIYFDGVHRSRVAGLIQSHERMLVKMKGYQNEIALHQYDAHLPLAHILKTLTLETVNQLLYYRSDRDLIAIVDAFRQTPFSVDIELKAIRALRQPHVARTDFKIGPVLRGWIEDRRTGDPRLLSAVVMLYLNLVPQRDFDVDDSVLLESLLNNSDSRVVANVVEVLTTFAKTDRLPKPKKVSDLRTAANTLIYEGRHEISSAILKRLDSFLKSKNVNMIASGLYAVGELAAFHRKDDVKYFAAHVDFQAVIAQLPAFAQHTTTMVRRQALIAARKAGNEDVMIKIRQHVKDSGSDLLQEELGRYLDSSSRSKTSAA